MELHSRLVHAEPGQRVVAVRALEQGRALGCALGEGPTAEAAEERAIARLLARLQEPQPPRASSLGQPATPAATAGAAAPPTNAPAAPTGSAGAPTRPAAAPPLPSTAPERGAPEAQKAPPAPPQVAEVASPHSTSSDHVDVPARSDGPRADPSSASASEPGGEPPADPEDWSGELAAIERALRRLGWDREQERVYLERAFGHPSRSRLTTYADLLAYLRALEAMTEGADPGRVPVPLRRRDLLAQSDQLLQQLGWRAEQGREFLERHLGASSRQQLRDEQLLQFNLLLEEALLGAGS